jgi:hypothetical protein
MKPATKASLLWGLTGALSFLVLVQGYELLAAEPIGAVIKAGVAVVVGVAAAATTRQLQGQL